MIDWARVIRYACLVSMFAAVGCDPNVVIGVAPDGAVLSDSGRMDADQPQNIEIAWRSGAHSGSDLAAHLAFGRWRGRPLDIVSLFPERTRWEGLVQPSWPIDMMRDFDGTLLLSLPLYPEGGGYNNRDCASGMYDGEWRKLGTFLMSRARGQSILRLGWGWNDLDHEWHADTDPADWIACYRRVVNAIRSTGPRLRFEWSFNPPGSPEIMSVDPYAAYPGDEYVDFVSFEAFDRYPPMRNESEWTAQCTTRGGLCSLFDFARQHGKRVGMGEWGVAACGGEAGGDNPFFVQRMVQAFAANRALMEYEAYFEESGEPCSEISTSSTRAPTAAARYRALYRE